MAVEVENSRIKSAFLGLEHHGIPTFSMMMESESYVQSFGGYDLRYEPYGIELLMEVLKVVGVQDWNQLDGKLVRIERADGMIKRIGHIVENKWLDVEEFGNRKREESNP